MFLACPRVLLKPYSLTILTVGIELVRTFTKIPLEPQLQLMEIRSNLSSHRTTTRHSSKQTEDDPEIEDLPAGQPPPLVLSSILFIHILESFFSAIVCNTKGIFFAKTDPLVQRDLDQLDKDGYVIIPNLLSESYLRELRMASEPHLTHVGRNNFEGLRTKRVYGLLGKSRTFDRKYRLIQSASSSLTLPF